MYMHEQLIANHAGIQKYADDVRRMAHIRHKKAPNKPWSRSNRYLKSKVVENLAKDSKDLDILSYTFQNRDKSQEASFNMQYKADLCA